MKFIIFALFYFVFQSNFKVFWRGDLTEGFLRYEFGGLVFGGAYTWRGLFSEFYGIFQRCLWLIFIPKCAVSLLVITVKARD